MVCRARILKKSTRTSPLSALLLALLAGAMMPTAHTASAATVSITKEQSGLVASDSLTSGTSAYWTFGGSAAQHNYYEDAQGLHLGVQSPSQGTWVNYYAGSPFVNAQVFHAVLTIPYTSMGGNDVFNPGLYVEGSDYNGIIGCVGWADSTGYYWAVQTTTDAGSTWKTLYQAGPSNLPQTQDCTVVTNGSNFLKVYLGGDLVFSGTTMNLKMPTPLLAFFQDDTSSSSSMHYATFFNYYATTNEKVTVTNAPAGGIVQIVDSTNKILASSPVASNGTATMLVGMYVLPLNAYLKSFDSSAVLVASTSSPLQIYGGDTFTVSGPPPIRPVPGTRSGLAASDSLTTGNTAYWVFGGSAAGQPGAKYTYSEDSQGMHIGVQSAVDGQWAGYYAVNGNTPAYLFHARLTLPYSTIPGQSFNTGLYVQTGGPEINYVTCAAQTSSSGYYWAVVLATGNATYATSYKNLWFQWMNNQPLTRDCTIVTNGANMLKVYLDGQVVYSNSTMKLGYAYPFQVFIEVQSSYSGQMLFGVYNNYYATTNEKVTVTNAPAGGSVQIVDSTNKILASSPVASNGTATMLVGMYALPLNAYVKVYDPSNTLVASTASQIAIWGGDVYTVS